jgi:mono/diheme cytochrome c family protein
MEDQIAVINEGRGAMPSFANTLTVGEIEAVALFEREKLGQD